MSNIIQRAIGAYRENGLLYVLRRGYGMFTIPTTDDIYNNYIRTRLPASEEYPKYNDTPIGADKHKYHIFDRFVPVDVPSSADRPEYEVPLVDAVQSCVRPGDNVVIIGGGYGVTTVAAAKAAREPGSVTVYEAIGERVDIIKNTVQLANVDGRCTAVHGIVGPAINPGGGLPGGGSTGSALHLNPVSIPACDVLELDCEGAELEILRNMVIRPHSIVVETHGHRGAPTEDVRKELSAIDYKVVNERVANEETDVYVLTATRTDR